MERWPRFTVPTKQRSDLAASLRSNQDVLTFDLSNLCRNTGTEVSGILGFQVLGMLHVKIDYRDGLVDFTYDPAKWHLH